MRRLARLLHCTEGRVYSVAIVSIIVALMLGFGLPPLFHTGTATTSPGPATDTTPQPGPTPALIPRFGSSGSPGGTSATPPPIPRFSSAPSTGG